jgi:hypothetical protein
MIVNEKRLKFERFLLPDEKVKCVEKVEGLKLGKVYTILEYTIDKVLLTNTKGEKTWYKTKYFKIC